MQGRGGPNGTQDGACLPSRDCFPPYLRKIVIEVEASGLPHVFKMWLCVGKGMLLVKYFCSNKASFCVG